MGCMKPIGFIRGSDTAAPLQKVASYAWLAAQITGREVSEAAIKKALGREDMPVTAANIAEVRRLAGRR